MSDDPPSMRDFDYFDDAQRPAGLEDVDELFEEDAGFEARLREYDRRQSRYLRQMVIAAVFFGVAIWFLWGFKDWISYTFAAPRPPVVMGDVVGLDHGKLAHNSFVELEGVTLHRGLVQKLVHGIGLSREEYHYFELSGSRGVFIEVAPEQGIEFTTFVKVAGRVIDPKLDTTYEPLLRRYQSRYYQERRPQERIIQVGIRPGEGKGPVLWAVGLLSALAALNLFTLVRVVRHRRLRRDLRSG
ncbi:MAG: hypothetical protein AAFQ82_01675 [Myxococcota bacterium]